MMQSAIDKTTGILNPNMARTKFQLTRHLPSPELAFYIEWYWIIHWDLRDQPPYTQEVLPYPSVNLAVEESASGLFGVTTGKFTRKLVNKGRVIAAKFKPGAFYPFVQSPVSNFTNKTTPLSALFGSDGVKLESTILAQAYDDQILTLMENFLCDRLPERDQNVLMVNEIIDNIIADRSITRVDELVTRIHINKRTLQRLFNQYVGVTPKWVIQRYRLQEAADQLAGQDIGDCTQMALSLGYFDQAHFIKDFKLIVGFSPLAYARIANPTRS